MVVSAVPAAMEVMAAEGVVAGRDASRHRAPAARCSRFCDCMFKEAEGGKSGDPGRPPGTVLWTGRQDTPGAGA